MFKKLLFGAAAAGAVAWLAKNQDKAKAYADRYGGQLKGAAPNVTPGAGRAPAEERLNDPALVQKVESEVFRDEHIPTEGHISVQRRVRRDLHPRRGARPEATWRTLTSGRAGVDGVRAVENLTHLPGEPAPKDETRSALTWQ